MDRDISPPPTKRRRVDKAPISALQPPPSTVLDLPPPGTMRIFSWNVNGISPFLQKSITSFFRASPKTSKETQTSVQPASLRDFLRRHHWPAMLLLQEVKIASKDTKTQAAVRAAINASSQSGSDEPQYEAHFTLPTDPHNARGPRGSGKVYGVCSIVRQDLYQQYDISFRTVPWDAEGRISVIELRSLKDGTKVAIYNIYAVNGTDNPYRDPRTGLQRGTRHDRKLAFHALLAGECKELDKQGWYVLLGGDMNVAPDERDGWPKLRTFPQQHVLNRADFHQRFLQAGHEAGGFFGVDVWREMHPKLHRYTYFPRGRAWGTSCDCVDYFVAGKRAWDRGMVKGSGICDSEAERGPSDHVPVWVDIRLEDAGGESK